jgi:serine protease Do
MKVRALWALALVPLLLPACTKRKKPGPAEEKPPPAAARAAINIFARPAFAYAGQGGAKQVSLSDIAERAVRSVVNVSSTRTVRQPRSHSPYGNPFFDEFFRFHGMPRERRARALGSGVIVSAEGVVLTNNHVVEKADEIEVILSDGSKLKARLVGTDPKSDLAVLRLEGDLKKIQPLSFGDSNKLRLGEVVLAIGNPFGVGQTVTMGIVSALGRANVGIVDYEDFIQTDAAINPGNSGGALVNMRGELVGINTAILSRSGGYQGIGFSIPAAMARPIMDSLLKHGKVIRGWLGVVIQDLSDEMAKAMGLPSAKGVLVADVQPDSPADVAGVKRGDVILALDGRTMDSVGRLRNVVAAAGSGAKVKLKLVREGKPREVTLALGVVPGDQVAKLDRSQGVLGGLTLEPLDEEARRKLGLRRGIAGVVVAAVEPASAADVAGLRTGDVILEINRQPVANPYQFSTVYKAARDRVLLLVLREGTTMYMLLEK